MGALVLHKPLLCRTHLHHKWAPDRTADGVRFTPCAHCGKDHTDVDKGNFDGKGSPKDTTSGWALADHPKSQVRRGRGHQHFGAFEGHRRVQR
ncbi:MAG: hypothetical protein QOG22_2922, partial [Pseudonocardiales bacterium]|nr:hypothetical protein [Pseudonocardiales bacterium]